MKINLQWYYLAKRDLEIYNFQGAYSLRQHDAPNKLLEPMLLKTYRPRRFFHHPLFIPFFHLWRPVTPFSLIQPPSTLSIPNTNPVIGVSWRVIRPIPRSKHPVSRLWPPAWNQDPISRNESMEVTTVAIIVSLCTLDTGVAYRFLKVDAGHFSGSSWREISARLR